MVAVDISDIRHFTESKNFFYMWVNQSWSINCLSLAALIKCFFTSVAFNKNLKSLWHFCDTEKTFFYNPNETACIRYFVVDTETTGNDSKIKLLGKYCSLPTKNAWRETESAELHFYLFSKSAECLMIWANHICFSLSLSHRSVLLSIRYRLRCNFKYVLFSPLTAMNLKKK